MARKKKNSKNTSKRRRRNASLGIDRTLDLERVTPEITALLESKKTKQALGLAKELYGHDNTPAAETLLTRAYHARVEHLAEEGLFREARALLDVVAEKQLDSGGRIEELRICLDVREGNILKLISIYKNPSTPPERLKTVLELLRDFLPNPKFVADSDLLDVNDPLRRAAQAAVAGFELVTSRKVENGEIQLQEISRRSPFAPWKQLIRGIEAFYRYEDDQARLLAAAVPGSSAPSSLARLLEQMIQEEPPTDARHHSLELCDAVLSGRPRLSQALAEADEALDRPRQKSTLRAVKEAVSQCERNAPLLVDQLCQLISIKGLKQDHPPRDLRKAMGRTPLKNAAFWRLYARCMERQLRREPSPSYIRDFVLAWNEYLHHGLSEGAISRGSIDEGVVYLHMAKHLASVDLHTLSETNAFLDRTHASAFRGYETGQPQEVKERLTRNRASEAKADPFDLYERAAAIVPDDEVFEQWFQWTAEHKPRWQDKQHVLEEWKRFNPKSTRALGRLAELSLQRGALAKALSFSNAARSIDPLDADLIRIHRQALTGAAVRHIKQGKDHLLQKDLAELRQTLGAPNSDQQGVLALIEAISALGRGDEERAKSLFEKSVAHFDNPLVAKGILAQLWEHCGLKPKSRIAPFLGKAEKSNAVRGEHTQALANIVSICRQMELPLSVPSRFEAPLLKESRKNLSSLGGTQLLQAAAALNPDEHGQILFGLSSSGLRLEGPELARVFYHRAKSLPEGHWGRRIVLFQAAATLARRQGDGATLSQCMQGAFDSADYASMPESLKATLFTDKSKEIDGDEIRRIVSTELKNKTFPKYYSGDPLEAAYRTKWQEQAHCDCPSCRAEQGEPVEPWELEDLFDDDDQEMDFDDTLPPGFGAELTAALGLSKSSTKADFLKAARRIKDDLKGQLPPMPVGGLAAVLEMLVNDPGGAKLPDLDDIAEDEPDLFDLAGMPSMFPKKSGRGRGKRKPAGRRR